MPLGCVDLRTKEGFFESLVGLCNVPDNLQAVVREKGAAVRQGQLSVI